MKTVDDITLKDISSIAQKLLSSPLTMASYGNGSSQFIWNLNTGFSCFIGMHFRLTCWFCSYFAVINVPSYDSVSRKFKWKMKLVSCVKLDEHLTRFTQCYASAYLRVLLQQDASIFNNKLLSQASNILVKSFCRQWDWYVFCWIPWIWSWLGKKVSIFFFHFCFTNYPKQILEWFFT